MDARMLGYTSAFTVGYRTSLHNSRTTHTRSRTKHCEQTCAHPSAKQDHCMHTYGRVPQERRRGGGKGAHEWKGAVRVRERGMATGRAPPLHYSTIHNIHTAPLRTTATNRHHSASQGPHGTMVVHTHTPQPTGYRPCERKNDRSYTHTPQPTGYRPCERKNDPRRHVPQNSTAQAQWWWR
jgi:hypothetical protein